MSPVVVDLLEVVDVEVEAGHRAAGAQGALHLFVQALIEIASVVHAGEGIYQPKALDLFVVDGVFDAHGNEARHALEKGGAGAGNIAAGLAAAEGEVADDVIAPYQRQERDALQRWRGGIGKVDGMDLPVVESHPYAVGFLVARQCAAGADEAQAGKALLVDTGLIEEMADLVVVIHQQQAYRL